jgi:erythromycin esterase
MVRRNRTAGDEPPVTEELMDQVAAASRPLRDSRDLDPLLDRVGDARFVLLGEASHGTAEFYTWRAALSKRLVEEKGFSFVAVEGDWPDCYRVNRYVKGYEGGGEGARDVLHAFARWPTWMWANEEVVDFVGWLRRHNDGLPAGRKAGFYGLDVYSLWDSLYAVMDYLHRHDPSALPAAWQAFRCFEPFGEDEQAYARSTLWDHSCHDEVVRLLVGLRRARGGVADRNVRPTGMADRNVCPTGDGRFEAEQNALVLKNAEAYYRAMVRGGPDSWNIRDRHMAETLDRLTRHHGPDAKAIVWEHNTHVGDARYTDMAAEGMVNVGQLVREAHGGEGVVVAGFGSHRGSVIAAKAWEAPMEVVRVPPGRPDSWEDVLHRATDGGDRLLLFDNASRRGDMARPRGHRAIGVVYRPEYEYRGNYVPSELPRRYDAFLYLDETHALHPLHLRPREHGEVPETYPAGV